MSNTETLVVAAGTLTGSGAISDAETVVIAGKTYTFQDTLTDVDGNVHVGADDAGTLSNLYAAINLSDDGESATGAGTDYAASMTKNTSVRAVTLTSTTVVVNASVPGAIGNNIATTETGTNLAWGAATLASGSGDIGLFLSSLLDDNQINSEVIAEIKKLTAQTD